VLPALAEHPNEPGGKARWFNQIHAHHRTFYQDCHPDFEAKSAAAAAAAASGAAPAAEPWPVHTKYGDGSEIEAETLAAIRAAVWTSSVSVPMTKGLLLCVDNYRALHGRLGFTPGTPRQSLVSIIYA